MRLMILLSCLVGQSVTWKLEPPLGTISQDGVYTAPTAIAQAQQVKITATTLGGASTTSVVNLKPDPCVPVPEKVTVTPATVELGRGESQKFTATVTPAVPCPGLTPTPTPVPIPSPTPIPVPAPAGGGFGMIRQPAPEVDPDRPGELKRVELPEKRNARINDPHTGAEIVRVTVRNDYHDGFGGHDKSFGTGSGGAHERCSSVAENGWVLCTAHQPEAANVLYAINQETGESRLLGAMLFTIVDPRGSTYGCNDDHQIFDPVNPRQIYCQPAGLARVLRLDYTLPYVDQPQGMRAAFNVTVLTPDLRADVLAFYEANKDQYTHDPAGYNCGVHDMRAGNLLFLCRYGVQDSAAWLGAYSIRDRKVIALTPMFAMPACRWCPQHSQDVADVELWIGSTQIFKGGGPGLGPYTTTLAASLTVTETTVVLAGEPSSPEEPKRLMDLAPGDMIGINNEYIRLLRKLDTNKWEILRAQGGTTAAAYPAGLTVRTVCANWPGAGPTQYPTTATSAFHFVWNYIADPFGKDATGAHQWANRYIGHNTGRGNRIVNNNSVAEVAPGLKAYEQKDPPYLYSVIPSPWNLGKHAVMEGNSFQQHPYYRAGLDWYVDVKPFIGVPSGSVTRVAGFQDVYEYDARTFLDPDGLNPEAFDTYFVSGTKALRNITGPTSRIGDDTPYTFCNARVDGECLPGSKAGKWYASAPEVTFLGCSGGESFGGQKDLCGGDFPMFGLGLVQISLTPNRLGVPDDAPPNVRGVQFSRVLARAGLNHGYRTMPTTANAKILPNGKWVLTTFYGPDRRDLVLVKVP